MAICTDTCCRPEYEGPVYVELAQRSQTARKEHICNGCHEPIPAGERYVVVVALVDSELEMRKFHQRYGCVWQDLY